jgi:flavin reductase (DIM6/NTAB) family NADH-FMN oxidoreductase RutF
MRKRTLPLSRVYRLLEPGPVVLLATARNGRPNVMAMSWHTMLEFEPPLVGCVVSNRNFTFATLRATKECVVAIPSAELAPKVVRCGNVSGRSVDKFAAFGLTPVPAAVVAAPLVAECPANLECKVVDTQMVNKYNFFVLEVLRAWIEPGSKELRTIHHRGRGVFTVAGRTIKLPSRMK